jgi:hypothetical protein
MLFSLASISRRIPPQARARAILAIDATMSRQPTWDLACKLQGEMFAAVTSLGSLDLQLVYYRGLRECCLVLGLRRGRPGQVYAPHPVRGR